MKSYIDKRKSEQNKKVHKVMSEYGRGQLKSGSGKKVTDRKQAIAIAMNESGQAKKKKRRSRKKKSMRAY